jgi:hypothetical protein
MSPLVGWPVAIATALMLLVGGFAPVTLAGPADQKGVGAPDIAAFESARFNLTGFLKWTGSQWT